MNPPPSDQRVVIVGAGLAGSLLAILLARRGIRVEVLERRADPRHVREGASEHRSINLGLSHRGLCALAEAGVLEQVLRTAVRARGRMIHATDGAVRFQPYGADEREVLYSIERAELNCTLVTRACELPTVTFRFGVQCESLDCEAPAVRYRDGEGVARRAHADLVVGADGAFSAVRGWMQQGERADYAREFLDWGYKELSLPAGDDGRAQMELEALHIWPRGDCLIVSHPNSDRSHTVTLFLPWEGERSFAALRTETQVRNFFAELFPDLLAAAPRLPEDFARNPTGTLVSIRTQPWHRCGRVVLVGDACHAVYPFYGQGMNAALEDCLLLDAALARNPGNQARALGEYQGARKRDTDALAELARRNFDELRDTANQPTFVARKKVDLLLSRLLPGRWMPLYTMVVHTSMPYAEALERERRQARLLRRWGVQALLSVALPLVARAQRARTPRTSS